MTTSKQYLNDLTVTTVHDLAVLWSALAGTSDVTRRSLTLVILDDDGRPAPVVVPIDDIPLVPSASDVDSFGRLLEHLAGYGTPVLLLSRPGSSEVQQHDREWARALASCAPRWPMHLATGNAYGRAVITRLSDGGDAGVG